MDTPRLPYEGKVAAQGTLRLCSRVEAICHRTAGLAGTWLGLKLYRMLDEVHFRKIVLILLLASGVMLLLR